jgi:acetamidase/formamidase
MKTVREFSLSFLFILIFPLMALTQDTIRFTPKIGYQAFKVREPVLRMKPGQVLMSETLMGAYYTEEGGAWPGEVGPIYIEGATPKDQLVIKLLKVRPNRDLAPARVNPNFGGLASDVRVRLLNPPIPDIRFLWRLDRQCNLGVLELPKSRLGKIEAPLAPMLGRVAVAPKNEESFPGLWPGDFGGNMDAPEIREGATVYLPIFHEGAYFYFGDGHALQGHGEIAGTGLEATMDVILQFDLIKNKPIDWPRLEDESHIMVAGSGRPLIDAFRLAHVELIEWLEQDYGFDRWEAYQVLSQVGASTVANIVDPQYTVVAKFPKKFLPKPEAYSLFGAPLYPVDLARAEKAKLDSNLVLARAEYDKNPNAPESLIWLGRRLSYLWRYREAIDVYSKGIVLHPNYAKLYRHRGHRYITVREFDKASADLEKAAKLIRGVPDEIEPDGAPNPYNVPTSTSHSNIWYHLGLAYYLKGDFKNALRCYLECMKFSKSNDDMLCATSDWLYMTYRRLGQVEEANKVLEPINEKMKILENFSYHKRLLMYKGVIAPDSLLDTQNATDLDIATQGYGVGNWYFYNGQVEKAKEIFEKVLNGKYWAAFGYIAAEADLKRLRP